MYLMAKKKKVPLYVDIDPDIRRRMNRLAEVRSRKLNAEVQIALRQYLDKEEKKEGLPPLPPEGTEEIDLG